MPSMASEPPETASLMRARLSMSLLSSEPARRSNALANSATRSSNAELTCPTVAWRRSSNRPERRSRSMIASSAVDCRLWRNERPRSSSVSLSLVRTVSSEPLMASSPRSRLSDSSLVREDRVSLRRRVRSSIAKFSFSAPASSVEACVANCSSSTAPRSDIVEVRLCRRMSNSLARLLPDE
ncbi:hypothetical protein D3C80_1391740 [compost metagenome]